MQETRVRFLGQEDSLGEGNGNPLQYSCLENPRDRGAWWATVHGVKIVGHNLGTKPPPPMLTTVLHQHPIGYLHAHVWHLDLNTSTLKWISSPKPGSLAASTISVGGNWFLLLVQAQHRHHLLSLSHTHTPDQSSQETKLVPASKYTQNPMISHCHHCPTRTYAPVLPASFCTSF